MHPPQRLPYNNYPLEGINHPHAHDVLCGRGMFCFNCYFGLQIPDSLTNPPPKKTGGQSNTHPGNTQWRTLVGANKELYVTLPKKQKMWLSQSIVNAVRSQNPPGRFLQKDSNQLWYDVGDKRYVLSFCLVDWLDRLHAIQYSYHSHCQFVSPFILFCCCTERRRKLLRR